MPPTDTQVLTMRIVDSLSDDEEFPEEIYLCVNFDLEERRGGGRSIYYFRAYKRTFRLTEILVALYKLMREEIVTARRVEGFDECCGPTSVLFGLTSKGQRYWQETVREVIDKCYDETG